jgi:hypothetical protein
MNILDPLLTFLNSTPDHSQADLETECQLLWARQQAIDKLMAGEIDGFYVLDFLEAHGVKPDDYVDQVVDNIEHVISTGQRPAESEIQIYLP